MGYQPDTFWQQTVRTFTLATEAALARHRRDHNLAAWQAWHTAYLPHRKRPLPLKRLMWRDKPQPQTWQQQMAVMEKFAAAHNKRLAERESLH